MLSRYKIGTKMGVGFGIVLVFLAIIGVSAFINIQKMNKATNEATGLRVNEVKLAAQLGNIQNLETSDARAYMLYNESSFLDSFHKHRSQFKDAADKLSGVLTSAQGKAAKDKIIEAEADYASVFEEQVIPAFKAGNMQKVKQLAHGALASADKESVTACNDMNAIIGKLMDKATEEANGAGKTAVAVVIVLGLIAAAIGVMTALTVTKSIVKPISDLVKDAEIVAGGDLTVNVAATGNDEVGQLSTAFGAMIESLRNTVGQVADTSDKVASASESLSSTSEEVGKATQQITETVSQVASGSEEQSKSVQSGAAAMEQLGRAVQEVSQGAQNQVRTVEDAVTMVQQISTAIDQVAALSQTAAGNGEHVKEVALDGGRQVAEAVNGMARIKDATDQVAEMVKHLGDSSQQIGAIVETIDDIAEQTNLLALNAAIEAARAGEHGKGFAVVADEVRKLAERSSKATGEIADLISHIQQMTTQAVEAMDRSRKEVDDGAQVGSKAGEALTHIQDAIASIVSQIEEMSSAAQQMSGSNQQVIKAIENVSAITEETSAAAEEMAASSGEVTQQIEQVAALSEENAAAAEEVAATTEEQNAAVEEMAAAAEDLAKMSEDLRDIVSKFKLTDNAATVVRLDSARLTGNSRQLRKAA